MNLQYKKFKFLYLFCAVFLFTASFYFWEQYLINHYLGGYDIYGLPAQKSANGFYFFISAWPVWTFPLFTFSIVLFFIAGIRTSRKIQDTGLAKKLVDKELECREFHAENIALHKTVKSLENYGHLKDDFEKVSSDYQELEQEYQKSLKFIESLLEGSDSKK